MFVDGAEGCAYCFMMPVALIVIIGVIKILRAIFDRSYWP